MRRRVVYLAAMATLGFTATFGSYAAGPVHAAEPPCPPDAMLGHQLTRSPLGECVDNTPPSTDDEARLAAKQAYANALANVGKAGSTTSV